MKISAPLKGGVIICNTLVAENIRFGSQDISSLDENSNVINNYYLDQLRDRVDLEWLRFDWA